MNTDSNEPDPDDDWDDDSAVNKYSITHPSKETVKETANVPEPKPAPTKPEPSQPVEVDPVTEGPIPPKPVEVKTAVEKPEEEKKIEPVPVPEPVFRALFFQAMVNGLVLD